MKKLSSTTLALLAFSVSSYAQAGFGAKIKSALNEASTELIVVGGGVMFLAIVLIAINAFFTPIQHLKRWVSGFLIGGLLLVFAEDIVGWFLAKVGGGSGF